MHAFNMFLFDNLKKVNLNKNTILQNIYFTFICVSMVFIFKAQLFQNGNV